MDATIEKFGQVDICVIGPGGGWHPETIDKLDSQAALDDVHKEFAPNRTNRCSRLACCYAFCFGVGE